MPRRRTRGRRQRGGGGIDKVHYPLAYSLAAGHEADTSIASIVNAFDRTRPFRISALRGEFSATKFPCVVQIQLYGPINSSDNVWSSPWLTIPTGTLRRFRYRVPASATGWYPSDTSVSTILMKVLNFCTNTGQVGVITGSIVAVVSMRPIEGKLACVSIQRSYPSASVGAAGSFATEDSSSDSELSEIVSIK